MPDYRQIFYQVCESSNTKVFIDNIDPDGRIYFHISIGNLNLSSDYILRNQYKIFTQFFADFLGEMLVRENLDDFAKILTDLTQEEYINKVNNKEYKGFGLEFSNNNFSFCFHSSLVQKILTEDLKKIKCAEVN